MAIFKPSDSVPGDTPNQRFGYTNTTFSSSPARMSTYPPRPQPAARPAKLPYSASKQTYAAVNQMLSNLDATYKTYSAARKLTWEEIFDLPYWELVCFLLEQNGDFAPPDDIGLAAYEAVNASRYYQMLPPVDDPPFDPFYSWMASLSFALTTGGPPDNPNLLHDVAVTLLPLSDDTPAPLNCSIYLRTGNRISPAFANRRRLKHIGNINLDLDIPVLLGNTLGQSQQWWPNCAATLEFRIGYPGSVERAAFEFSFQNS